ncbi:hypothetical protein MPSEU_000544700 [Mayamaea pseudoterrestris]|nr:hypothetical protein MPSEU_000544700 [Mayamaea pseudoterrestris]
MPNNSKKSKRNRTKNGITKARAVLDSPAQNVSSLDPLTMNGQLTHRNGTMEEETLYTLEDEGAKQDKDLDVLVNGNGHANGEREQSTHFNTAADTLFSHAPLTTTPSRASILIGAAANLCSATLGAGVLALPFAMQQAGIIVGMLLLLASAGITIVSIRLLVIAQTTAADSLTFTNVSMEGLVSYFLGHRMKQLTEVCIVVFCVGCSVSYVIAVGDILYITLGWKRLSSMLIVWLTLMMPLSMFRRMKSFQWTSGTGVAAIGTLVFCSLWHLINDDYGHTSHDRWDTNDTWVADVTYGPYVTDLGGNSTSDDFPIVKLTDYLWPADGVISVLKACPIVMFAFSCQINVPSIYLELDNNQQLMHKVAYLSVSVCFLLYASISIIALADFGDRIEPNVLVNYKHDSGMMQFATASMAAAVITAFPLNVFPARIAVIGVWKRYLARRMQRQRQQANETLTAALLEDADVDDTDDNRSAGSNGSQYGTIGRSLSLDAASDLVLEEPEATLPVNGVDDEEMFDLRQHICVTLLLTGLALGCAILIPDISVVFGLLGGTTTSVLGYMIPGTLALRLNDQKLVCVASILLVGGILISILTTSVTVYSTFHGSVV